jgi:hypothetical protein
LEEEEKKKKKKGTLSGYSNISLNCFSRQVMILELVYGGDVLQIWTIAVNILNKQSGTANKGWFSSLAVV